jgi:hypothetical protein
MHLQQPESIQAWWMRKNHMWLLMDEKKSYVACIGLSLASNDYWRFLCGSGLAIAKIAWTHVEKRQEDEYFCLFLANFHFSGPLSVASHHWCKEALNVRAWCPRPMLVLPWC